MLLAVVVSAAVAAGLAALGPAIIVRLPEPKLAEDREDKLPYADLGARPGLVWKLALVGALAGAVVGWQLHGEGILPAWVYLAGMGVILGYVDSQLRLLPTVLIAPSYAVMVVLVGFAYLVDRDTDDVVRAALGWIVMGGFFWLVWRIYPRGMGYGDVRLSGVLGIALGYVGWGALAVGLYAGFLIGGIGGLLLSMARLADRKKYPFGPFMLLGAIVGLIWGQPLADWYLN